MTAGRACTFITLFFLVGSTLWADEPKTTDRKSDRKSDEKADTKADGWITLFDGKSLDGWKASENPDNWKVEDGAIVGRGSRSHLFYVKDTDFTNFELSAEVKTEKGTNSGIYFHTKFQQGGWPETGLEAQVNNTQGDPVKTGSLYYFAKLYKTDAKDGEWWTQAIRVEGKRVTISVNGKQVVDYTEPDDIQGKRKLGSGTFALQQHDPSGVVRFRNLKVRKLESR